MSITISECSEICKNPLNNSTAKMLYSFPKQPRFAKKKQILCDKFYPQTASSHFRTTSFGFGDKYDFTKDASCSPPPNTYNLEDCFSKNINKGFGFGKGRNQMEVTGPFVAAKKNKNPGPDSYQLPSMLEKNSFAFRSKLNTFDNSKQEVPGPGNYPVTFSINQKGKYFLAKYKTVYARDFGKYTSRCQTSQQKYPGPGSYSVKGINLSPKGKYISSKLHNCLVSSFQGSPRKFLGDKSNTPGPGNYRLPSDFGYYESGKNLSQTLEKVQRSNLKFDNESTKNFFEGKENLKVEVKSKRDIQQTKALSKNIIQKKSDRQPLTVQTKTKEQQLKQN